MIVGMLSLQSDCLSVDDLPLYQMSLQRHPLVAKFIVNFQICCVRYDFNSDWQWPIR